MPLPAAVLRRIESWSSASALGWASPALGTWGSRYLVVSGLLSLGLPERVTREAFGPEAPAGVEMRSRPSSPEGKQSCVRPSLFGKERPPALHHQSLCSRDISLGAGAGGDVIGGTGSGVGRGAEALLALQGSSPDPLASLTSPTPQGTCCSCVWVALKEGPGTLVSASYVCRSDS